MARKLVAPVTRIKDPSGKALAGSDMIAKSRPTESLCSGREKETKYSDISGSYRSYTHRYLEIKSSDRPRHRILGLLRLCHRLGTHKTAAGAVHQCSADWSPDPWSQLLLGGLNPHWWPSLSRYGTVVIIPKFPCLDDKSECGRIKTTLKH